MTINAAQYVRMSTDQQPMSPDIQEAAIAAFAESNGFKIVRTYCDEAKSGLTVSGRKGMQTLLRDVMDRACPFKAVLVLDVTRWGRFQDVDEAAYHEYHCRKHGVRVEYVAEPFSRTNSPFDAVMKQMKRASAAEYSRDLGVKVRAGQMHVIDLGFTVGSLPCVGYRRQAFSADGTPKQLLSPKERKPMVTDHTRWVLGPEIEQSLVRRIFNDYNSGASLRTIARALNSEGARTHNDRQFSEAMIVRLVRNEIVLGVFKWCYRRKGQVSPTRLQPLAEPRKIEALVPALISIEVWEAAQARYARSVLFRKEGLGRSNLLQKLSDALEKNPRLKYIDFQAAGLSQPITYARQFGSLSHAYLAAGRPQTADQLAFAARSVETQAIPRQVAADLTNLLLRVGITAAVQPSRNILLVRGIEVKVCALREVAIGRAPRWRTSHIQKKRAANRWLLLMRLNPDGETGKDFFLLPPSVHATFCGTLNGAFLSALRRYRVDNAAALLDRLRRMR